MERVFMVAQKVYRPIVRTVSVITLVVIITLLIAACGSNESGDSGEERPATMTPEAQVDTSATAFAEWAMNVEPQGSPAGTAIQEAIDLRESGQIDEALAAYDRYAEMFAETDPGAEQYAKTAKQFTLQLDDLAVQGGAYLVGVADDSAAGRAGLVTGDIIIEANGILVHDADELWNVLQARTIGDPVEIVYLRLDEDDVLRSHQVTVEGTEKLGIWFILI